MTISLTQKVKGKILKFNKPEDVKINMSNHFSLHVSLITQFTSKDMMLKLFIYSCTVYDIIVT